MKKKRFLRLFLTLVIFILILTGCTDNDSPERNDTVIADINTTKAVSHEIESEMAYMKVSLPILEISDNTEGEIQPPLPESWAYLSAGRTHIVAIGADGSLWAWGGNRAGQLGDGTTIDRLSPVRIGADYDWASVSAGQGNWDAHTAAIRTDGSLWTWGRNSEGQLGNGTRANSAVPIQIMPDYKMVSVSAGMEHTAAVRDDGTLWIWGSTGFAANGHGRGTSPISHGNTPVQLGEDADWVLVSAGANYTAAIKTDGSLWGWRGDEERRWSPYEDSVTRHDTPIQIGTYTDWVSVSAGRANAFAIRSDGSLWGWGDNGAGQLGDGTRTSRSTPVQIKVSSNGISASWASVVSGHFHAVALKTDGSLWTWGVNVHGELGDGTGGRGWGDRSDDRHSPARVGVDYDWVSIAASDGYTVAMRANGSLWTWGDNQWGQLGDGTTTSRSSPLRITP